MAVSIRGFAVAAALGGLLLALLSPPPPCAAARPLAMAARGSATTTSSEEAMIIALAPSAWSPSGDERGGRQWRAAGAAAAMAGKWLPFVAGGGAAARYPYGRPLWGLPSPAAAAGRMVPWAAATAAPGLVFRTGGQLMEEEPHVEDAAARQEQAAMWASLLNPAQVRPAPAWTMAGNGEAEAPPADAELTAEGMDVGDEPPAGGMLVAQPKWPGSP
uniref:Dof-type domain-containing protein n=1 Tax=Oryza punctata TaxID=4537 RepID=A0A0E0KGM9_ORYPU